MLQKELELKKHVDLDLTFNSNPQFSFDHALIKELKNIKVKGSLNYESKSQSVVVKAQITTDIYAIDARDGKDIFFENQVYDWNEQYFFQGPKSDQVNNIEGDDFCVEEYAIEQIVLNIPINLTKNYDKILFAGEDYIVMSEDEYESEQLNKIDPRWEKLKDFKFEKK